jgi:hypothetical protein
VFQQRTGYHDESNVGDKRKEVQEQVRREEGRLFSSLAACKLRVSCSV